MARIRSIKPETPHSASLGRVSRDARLLFILLWTIADDYGRLRGTPRFLAGVLFPYDDDADGLIGGWLAELVKEGHIVRYEANRDHYIAIPGWSTHQRIDKPSKSRLPGPPEPREDDASPERHKANHGAPGEPRELPLGFRETPGISRESPEHGSSRVVQEGKGVERKGPGEEGVAIAPPPLSVVGPPPVTADAPESPRLGPRRSHSILVSPRDLSAFWEGPVCNLPGKWAAKVIKASNGRLTEADLSAFGRHLNDHLLATKGEAPSDGYLGYLDLQLTLWRTTVASVKASQAAAQVTRAIIADQATHEAEPISPEQARALLHPARSTPRG
jgi:hypothetical protein